METEEVFEVIRPASETLKLLILHSTDDSLGQDTANSLEERLGPAVQTQVQHVKTYGELHEQLERVPEQPFHVVLFLVHGGPDDKGTNVMWLIDDKQANGKDLGTSVGEMLPIWKAYTRKCLLLFGVCGFGMSEICLALKLHAAAAAAVAPREEIYDKEIITEFGQLLESFSKFKGDIKSDFVREACKQLSPSFQQRIIVYADDGLGSCP